jgi:hypothetical protein
MNPLFNGWTIPLRISGMALSSQSDLLAFIITRKVNLKIPVNAGLRQARIARPLEDVFRLLVSSNPLWNSGLL